MCRLKKSLYGLKQAHQQWYLKFDSFMHEHGYIRFHSYHCVYFKILDDDIYIILCLYVDDKLVDGSNMVHQGAKMPISKCIFYEGFRGSKKNPWYEDLQR